MLLSAFVEFARRSEEAFRSAIGIDIREKGFPERFPALYGELKSQGCAIELLFLDASDQTIVRRFSETRRPHPLARGTTPLLDGIRKERAALAEVKKLADRIIDTSDYTVHDLRQTIERHYAAGDAGRPMVITLLTFGYKFGVPYDLDLLFDLRFLPNPHFVPELRPSTGEDRKGQRIHHVETRFRGIPGQAPGVYRVPSATLPKRGEKLSYDRVWMHGRQASVSRGLADDRGVAQTERLRRHYKTSGQGRVNEFMEYIESKESDESDEL